jgi:integrase
VFAAGVPNVGYNTAHRRWKRLLKELGMPYRVPHQMRHSWASLAIASGAPLADVAAYLGDSVQILVKTYCHPVGFDVAGLMGGVIFGGKSRGRK